MQRINEQRGDVRYLNFGKRSPNNGFAPTEKSSPDFWGVDHKYLVTPTDAKRLGIKHPSPPPPGKCQYCGKPLEWWGLRNPLDGSYVRAWHKLMKCTCEKAIYHWRMKGEKPYEPRTCKTVYVARESVTADQLEAQGVPKAYAASRFTDYDSNPDLMSQIRTYRAQYGLVVTAEAGGADKRQHVAAAFMRAAQDNGLAQGAQWINEAAIADKDFQLDHALEFSPLLVIAEAGVASFTPYGFGRLYYCLEGRHGDKKPTILTMPHKGLGELARKWGECGNAEQVQRLIEILATSATMI